ncbi:YsnF/AvaK domain-containing protein [Clostridium bovifaecis]|uniref:YsnF/AvaK domain-containing protein n=1 Tax=Clostridium bovifaecis TaxID=2184719 RepID=A0A6I6EQ54_9CLOT|nr:YsnF/AvaK domain-containing protein [Clostridium bovifaecis]
MSRLFGIFDNEEDRKDIKDTVEEGKLRLRQEELDINKNKVHTGDVELSKEIIEETKTVDVPVIHEEVVIERRVIDNEASDSPITDEETIRIPVSEEKVDVNKHTVITGEISAYKREIEDVEHIEETLKKEEARVNTLGDANVVSDETAEEER